MKPDLPAMTVAENLGTYEHKRLTLINIYYIPSSGGNEILISSRFYLQASKSL